MGFKITMPKSKVIEILNENMVEHRETYEKAIEIYREKIIADLNNKLDRVKAGQFIETVIRLPLPEEHTDDFKRAIDMLNYDVNGNIELDEATYEQYVNNEWSWNRAFLANTAGYANGTV